jgi:ABC-type glycerol-3-phosphate transport system substrate-binding protein
MKKALCLFIAAVTILSAFAFAGCADKPADTTAAGTTAAEVTTEPEETEILPELPDVKYDGRVFRVILPDGMESDVYTEDHETSEPVHDAVFKRNKTIEERYGIEFVVIKDDLTAVNNRIRNSVKSGSSDYDLCFVQMVAGSALAQSNSVLPFEKLPYVDLSKPWWDKDIGNGFSIRNNLMMVNGDISPTGFAATSAMYFNKTMFDKRDLEYPYQLVKDGKWTLDRLYELTKDITSDVDGDGKISADGKDDIFGLSSWYLDVPYSFYYAAGGMLVFKDQDDVPYFDPNIERDTKLYEKIYDVIISNNAYFETNISKFPNVAKLFFDGRALFLDAKLDTAEELREMDDDYGIIPVPKLDEYQTEYKSFVNGAANMVCVPATVKGADLEYVSVIVEAMAAEAYKTVTPVMYETYLKRKVTRDAESAEMIDYIVRNRVFDMAYVNLYENVGSYVRDLLVKKSTDVSSTLKKYQKTAGKKIEGIVKAFDKSMSK